MFSALSLGSSVYLLDKTSTPEFKTGEVIGVSSPKLGYNFATVDLKVKIGDSIQEYNNLPSVNNIVTYNNGKIIISETKQGILNEVETLLLNSKQILDNIDTYKLNVIDCESILKLLNPLFAKDKERDERLSNLEDKFGNFESKLDKIFELVKK